MNITSLQFSSGSYRTTNPPISESHALTVCKDAPPFGEPRFLLRVKDCFNAHEQNAEYPLTRAQYDEITALFERLRVDELLFKRMHEDPVSSMIPPQVGGESHTALTFTANGVSVTVSNPPQETFELLQHLQSLRAAFAKDDPSAMPDPNPSIYGIAVPPSAPQPKPQPSGTLAAGEWFCPNCGQRNSGAFCSECGTPR